MDTGRLSSVPLFPCHLPPDSAWNSGTQGLHWGCSCRAALSHLQLTGWGLETGEGEVLSPSSSSQEQAEPGRPTGGGMMEAKVRVRARGRPLHEA